MKSSTKAVLLSGHLLPGAGHLYLRRYIVGGVFMLVAAVAVYFMLVSAISAALDITREIEADHVPLDLAAITQQVAVHMTQAGQSANAPALVFLVAWGVGVLDVLRPVSKQFS